MIHRLGAEHGQQLVSGGHKLGRVFEDVAPRCVRRRQMRRDLGNSRLGERCKSCSRCRRAAHREWFLSSQVVFRCCNGTRLVQHLRPSTTVHIFWPCCGCQKEHANKVGSSGRRGGSGMHHEPTKNSVGNPRRHDESGPSLASQMRLLALGARRNHVTSDPILYQSRCVCVASWIGKPWAGVET